MTRQNRRADRIAPVALSPGTQGGKGGLGNHAEGRLGSGSPTHGHEPTHEAAMAACAKSWRRGAAVMEE
jgi:hypothetical protein